MLNLRSSKLDVGRVKTFIGEMEKVIEDTVIRNSVAEVSTDLDRVRWKAIYLSALLFTSVHKDKKKGLTEGFRMKARMFSQSRGLSLVGDRRHCLGPLGIGVLRWRALGRLWEYSVFESWINGFPLIPLPGSITSARTWKELVDSFFVSELRQLMSILRLVPDLLFRY